MTWLLELVHSPTMSNCIAITDTTTLSLIRYLSTTRISWISQAKRVVSSSHRHRNQIPRQIDTVFLSITSNNSLEECLGTLDKPSKGVSRDSRSTILAYRINRRERLAIPQLWSQYARISPQINQAILSESASLSLSIRPFPAQEIRDFQKIFRRRCLKYCSGSITTIPSSKSKRILTHCLGHATSRKIKLTCQCIAIRCKESLQENQWEIRHTCWIAPSYWWCHFTCCTKC